MYIIDLTLRNFNSELVICKSFDFVTTEWSASLSDSYSYAKYGIEYFANSNCANMESALISTSWRVMSFISY